MWDKYSLFTDCYVLTYLLACGVYRSAGSTVAVHWYLCRGHSPHRYYCHLRETALQAAGRGGSQRRGTEPVCQTPPTFLIVTDQFCGQGRSVDPARVSLSNVRTFVLNIWHAGSSCRLLGQVYRSRS